MTAQIIPFPARRQQFLTCRSFATCMPVTPRGFDWIAHNIGNDVALPLAIEFRCLEDIVLGARADGLVCDG